MPKAMEMVSCGQKHLQQGLRLLRDTNCRSRGNGKGIQRIPLRWEYMQEEILSRRGSESELAYSTGERGQSYFVRGLVYILGLQKILRFFQVLSLNSRKGVWGRVSRRIQLWREEQVGGHTEGQPLWTALGGPLKAFPVYPGPFWGVGSSSITMPYPIF